jgi:hypothetical protein
MRDADINDACNVCIANTCEAPLELYSFPEPYRKSQLKLSADTISQLHPFNIQKNHRTTIKPSTTVSISANHFKKI